ncbi:MAG: transposase [bacterium]|nr:transposase [bacterium]
MVLFHLLNRGVDKRKVFMDEKDYYRFIHDLFEFNDTASSDPNLRRFSQMLDVGRPTLRHVRKLLVQLHAFCLMPNHYHLLVSPLVDNGVSLFMKKLNGGYSKYFNEKYKRSGALWQGKYKSVPIEVDPHFSWIPYYIHFNPLDLSMPEWRERGIKNQKKALDHLNSYRFSSHLDYWGKKNFPSLTQRDFLLEFFEGEKGYRNSIPEILKGFSVETGEGVALE